MTTKWDEEATQSNTGHTSIPKTSFVFFTAFLYYLFFFHSSTPPPVRYPSCSDGYWDKMSELNTVKHRSQVCHTGTVILTDPLSVLKYFFLLEFIFCCKTESEGQNRTN